MAKFLAGYASEIADEDCRKRYEEKISNIGMDPYDADKASFSDNVDLWPAITSIHVGMYLVFSPVLIQEILQKHGLLQKLFIRMGERDIG